jgi:hypothetical protein
MDKIFRAIGAFFKKIWEWIKTTAWVQPVLIVIIIFGIIFSINPIVNAIKSAVNSDDAGEFYDDHGIKFNALYQGISNQGPRYNRRVTKKGKYILTETSGDILVIYTNSSSTLEDKVASFYNSTAAKGCKLYVVDFSTSENQKSKYDKDDKEYIDDDAATYYSFLLEKLQEAYNDEGENSWRSYNDAFKAKYKYEIFYSGFADNDNKYETTGTTASQASSDMHLPAAVKYHNGKIVDMRFASSSTWSGYNTSATNYDDINILMDMWTGVEIAGYNA